MADETPAGIDLDRVIADLRELAAGRMLPIAVLLNLDEALNCCTSLDDMIESQSALLVYLLERREFARRAVKARIPAPWRSGPAPDR